MSDPVSTLICMRHVPRSTDISDYANMIEYFVDQPVGEVGEAIIELELQYPREGWRKRRAIRRRLGPEFTPGYYELNLIALLKDPATARDFPAVTRELQARRGWVL